VLLRMETAIIVALCLSIVGNIINAWGMIYMKIGHEAANAKTMRKSLQKYMEMRALEEAGEKQDSSVAKPGQKKTAELSGGFLKQCKWWIGMALYGGGSFMHVASLGFGPSALLNPMEGLTLVANTLSAPSCLGEAITKYDIWGTIVIVVGTLMVVLFGPHSSEEYTAEEILDRFGNSPFIIWSACLWTCTGVAYTISRYIEYINERDDIQMDGTLNPRGSIFLALTYTSTKGVMGGYTMLFGKMFAEVVAESGEGDNQFVKWETYLFFVLFIGFNFLMEYWRQKALNLFSTMYCVPLFQVTLVIFAVFTGAIFFDEFSGLSVLNLCLFFLGIVIICIGVVILSVMTESRKMNAVKPRTKMRAAFLAVAAIFFLKPKSKRSRDPGNATNDNESPKVLHKNLSLEDINLDEKVDDDSGHGPNRSPNRSPIPWERSPQDEPDSIELPMNALTGGQLVLQPVG